ncbi:MAG: translation initiation factor IF-3 [Ignavibacteria bacterium]|nr:translation initiation factor IF-3 [Ignavibacteria bacterium]
MKSTTAPNRQDGRASSSNKYRINQEIRVPEVRLFDAEGNLIGIRSRSEALHLAELNNLDLVETVPNGKPPVCKIIDYGKFIYEAQKKDKQMKKSQTQQLLKEIRFKWRTDTHDYNFKLKHARNFIDEGNKVKATIVFRGREITHSNIGEELIRKFVADTADIAKIDGKIKLEGKSMYVIITPTKPNKKSEQDAEETSGQEN